jgi:lipid II:glycine glycyltransferase (peptidoglycan interpeptide bridge formation enzyme)
MNLKYIFEPNNIDKDKWLEYVTMHPNGNIFQTPQMYEVYKNAKNYKPVFICCVDETDEIRGVLLSSIFSEKSGITSSLISRSISIGAPLLSNGVQLQDFLIKFISKVKDDAVYSRLVNLFDKRAELESMKSIGFEFKDHLNYLIKLDKDESELWTQLHNTRRRQIKRGHRRGARIEQSNWVDNISEYYKILHNTYSAAGLPLQDISFFESAMRSLSKSGNLVFFSAFDGKRLIGHRMILAFNGMLHDWFAGDIPEARDKYTNDILVWEVLKYGRENSFKCFDFGGAGEPGKEYGVRDFKKKFGGDLVSYGNYFIIHKKMRYKLLRFLMSIYNRLKN